MSRFISSIFIIAISGFYFNSLAQSKNVRKNTSVKSSKENAKKQELKLFSAGVVNRRALNLIEPEYPESALAMQLSGEVQVEVIIDAAGYVLEAKALKGHKLLRKPSLEAAKDSKFAPYFLNGQQIKIKGIIIYKFVPNSLNWLEIGYHAIETERIKFFLPNNFKAERDIISKMNSTETDYDPNGFKNLVSSIENKLRTDDKNLWLFKLGITLRKLLDNQWDAEAKTNAVTEIQTLLYIKPKNASPNLVSKLENLVKYNQENIDLYNKELSSIIDRFYILGK